MPTGRVGHAESAVLALTVILSCVEYYVALVTNFHVWLSGWQLHWLTSGGKPITCTGSSYACKCLLAAAACAWFPLLKGGSSATADVGSLNCIPENTGGRAGKSLGLP